MFACQPNIALFSLIPPILAIVTPASAAWLSRAALVCIDGTHNVVRGYQTLGLVVPHPGYGKEERGAALPCFHRLATAGPGTIVALVAVNGQDHTTYDWAFRALQNAVTTASGTRGDARL